MVTLALSQWNMSIYLVIVSVNKLLIDLLGILMLLQEIKIKEDHWTINQDNIIPCLPRRSIRELEVWISEDLWMTHTDKFNSLKVESHPDKSPETCLQRFRFQQRNLNIELPESSQVKSSWWRIRSQLIQKIWRLRMIMLISYHLEGKLARRRRIRKPLVASYQFNQIQTEVHLVRFLYSNKLLFGRISMNKVLCLIKLTNQLLKTIDILQVSPVRLMSGFSDTELNVMLLSIRKVSETWRIGFKLLNQHQSKKAQDLVQCWAWDSEALLQHQELTTHLQ